MLGNVKRFMTAALRGPGLAPAAFEQDWENKISTVEGWLSHDEAWLLWALSGTASPEEEIVEIGSYLGRSTVALATGSAGARVSAVDPHTGDISEVERGLTVNTWEGFQSNLKRCQVNDIVTGIRTQSVAAAQHYSGPPIALLFIDGWHSTEAVSADIREWSKHLGGEPSIVIDDWTSPPVAAGILMEMGSLPPLVGAIGKDLILSANPTVLRLPIVRAARRLSLIQRPLKHMRLITR
jgi:predicted O-methyltransferase YrrM